MVGGMTEGNHSEIVISIRPATVDDAAEILRMIQELAEFERLSHEVKASVDDIRKALDPETRVAEALIAEAGGEIAGFALFFTSFSTFEGKPGLYLEDIFVRERFRRIGIGKGLFLRLAAIAGARGCARYEWEVLDWNEDAILFYKRYGSEIHGAWRRMRLSGEALQKLLN
jgi:GNAT superfamily N-acetyltransferase